MKRLLLPVITACLLGGFSNLLIAADTTTCEVYAKAAVTANDRASRMACANDDHIKTIT